jgi:outer membrane immunogenic protein
MLRRIFLASAGAMTLSGMAFAAEPLPMPPPPPPPPQWTGLYLGINAGGTWSSDDGVNTSTFPVINSFFPADAASLGFTSSALASTSVPVNISGFIGGGTWGTNYQINNWVIGAEGDFQGIATSNQTDTLFRQSNFTFAGVNLPISQHEIASRGLDWLGTERVRAGYLFTPTFLAYGTAGLAYGQTQMTVAIAQPIGFPGFFPGATVGNFGQTLAGWTAGGGVEWLFYPNWSLKVEYLYYDLGHLSFGMSPLVHSFIGIPLTVGAPIASTRFDGNIVRAGLNYHFNLFTPPVVAKY